MDGILCHDHDPMISSQLHAWAAWLGSPCDHCEAAACIRLLFKQVHLCHRTAVQSLCLYLAIP